MYKITYMTNCNDGNNYDIFEKEMETIQEAEEMYSELFGVVKGAIVEDLESIITQSDELAPVLRQIADVVNDLEPNEEIVLQAKEEPFLTVDCGEFEFKFIGRHIVLRMLNEEE